jgi:hypothetical protein
MKCDRRWYYDGRHEQVCEEYSRARREAELREHAWHPQPCPCVVHNPRPMWARSPDPAGGNAGADAGGDGGGG